MRIGSQFFVMSVTIEIVVSILFISMPQKEYFVHFLLKIAPKTAIYFYPPFSL
jgi:hypothetical protein